MNLDFELLHQTPNSWGEYIAKNMDLFLIDHAAAEKKASGMAMSLISHYPDKKQLVADMVDLAVEELHHYRDVIRIIQKKAVKLLPEVKDNYIKQIRLNLRSADTTKDYDCYLLDRLLVASVIEARGVERFQLVADNLENDKELSKFYQGIANSERRHYLLFLNLAQQYFADDIIQNRLDQLLQIEAEIIAKQPLQATLH